MVQRDQYLLLFQVNLNYPLALEFLVVLCLL